MALNRVIRVGDYLLLEEIGTGGFSRVYKGTYSDRNRPKTFFAIKKISGQPSSPFASIIQKINQRECPNMYRVQHDNVIKLLEMFQTTNNAYFVMELAELGSLRNYLTQNGNKLNEERAKYFIKQLADGLKALYDCKILHRDIKPENLVLCGDKQNPTLKITDLGLSKYVGEGSAGCSVAGTRSYMAPEVFRGQMHYYKVDLWSTGITLYEILTGQLPFKACKSEYELQAALSAGINLKKLQCSESCKDFLGGLLQIDQQKRFTFDQFYNHPWLRSNQVIEETKTQVTMEPVVFQQKVEKSIQVDPNTEAQNTIKVIENLLESTESISDNALIIPFYQLANMILTTLKVQWENQENSEAATIQQKISDMLDQCGYNMEIICYELSESQQKINIQEQEIIDLLQNNPSV